MCTCLMQVEMVDAHEERCRWDALVSVERSAGARSARSKAREMVGECPLMRCSHVASHSGLCSCAEASSLRRGRTQH